MLLIIVKTDITFFDTYDNFKICTKCDMRSKESIINRIITKIVSAIASPILTQPSILPVLA